MLGVFGVRANMAWMWEMERETKDDSQMWGLDSWAAEVGGLGEEQGLSFQY